MRVLISLLAVLLAVSGARADPCTERGWISQNEQCFGFGAMTRLKILKRGIDMAFSAAGMPSLYAIVVVPKGRAGALEDAYVSTSRPEGMERQWFENFYVYVTPEFLAERDGYPALIRAGAQLVCESDYLHYPPSPNMMLARRTSIERCVYRAMRNTEQYYFAALAREIERGDPFFLQFKGMPYIQLRETIREQFGK